MFEKKWKFLHAWWHGLQIEPELKKPDVSKPEPGQNRYGKPTWHATRLEVAEKIFKNKIYPLSENQLQYWFAPLGCNPAMQFLEIGAGIGTCSRFVLDSFGTHCLGLEESPFLVKEFNKRLPGILKGKILLKTFDRNNFSVLGKYDIVFSNMLFYTIENKENLVKTIYKCLKPGGQLLFTDFLIEEPMNPELEKWMNREELKPYPISTASMQKLLTDNNLAIIETRDLSEPFFALITKCFWDFSQFLQEVTLPQETKNYILNELEVWSAREFAVRKGLRVGLFYATKKRNMNELIE